MKYPQFFRINKYINPYTFNVETTFSYQDTSSCSDFISPRPKNRTTECNVLENANEIDFESSDSSSSITKEVNQCNTIVHGPNSRCLTQHVKSPSISPLPGPYHQKVPFAIPNRITGIKHQIYEAKYMPL